MRARSFLAALFMLGATNVVEAADTPADVVQRALGEAKKVAPDLRLVQLQFLGFAFATGKNGIPDMTREGPPKGAVFYFLAPRSALRIFIRMNRDAQYPPDVLKTLRERGVLAKDIEVETLTEPHSPFTLPLPDTFLDLGRAIDAAKNAAAADCAGEDPRMSSCRLVQTAELHMHWNERGDAAGPVWRITFGQHSRTLASVQQDVDAKTGRVFARDAPHSSFTELDQKPERFTRVLLPVGRTFDSLWPAVNDAVRKQDPRYRPYAVTLVTQLGEYQRAPSGGYLWMAHIRFARETPSWMWDDLEAHLGWRADGQAVLDFSPPERLRGPRQVIPIVIDDRKLPSADATLRAFLRQFPSGYFEEYMTFEWDESCRIVSSNTIETPSGDHVVRTTTTHSICGEFRLKNRRTDRVYFWLSNQDNRKWLFGVGPIDSEYEMVRTNVPKNSWTWWTRVKHAAYWQYFMVDPATGQGMTRCTAPNDGSSAIAMRSCP